MSIFTQLKEMLQSDEQKAAAFLTIHKQAVESVIELVAKEYEELDGAAKMVQAINFVEALLGVPAIVQSFTPEVVNAIQNFIQKTYDAKKATV